MEYDGNVFARVSDCGCSFEKYQKFWFFPTETLQFSNVMVENKSLNHPQHRLL